MKSRSCGLKTGEEELGRDDGRMKDAFTLVRQAVDMLPADASAASGATVADVREDIARQEWALAHGLLVEIGERSPTSVDFWDQLAEAARQMTLDRSHRWCRWRSWEIQYGTVRATLSLLESEEGGRRGAFRGDGRLRPLWDIGSRSPDGEPELAIARLWVEFAEDLGPGETADVRLAPLSPERWRHLRNGDVITMHEARPAVGTAVVSHVS